MSKLIHKTVLRVVVLSTAPFPVHECGLEDLARAIEPDGGTMIGGVDLVNTYAIQDPAVLRRELITIGNDGEFFDDL